MTLRDCTSSYERGGTSTSRSCNPSTTETMRSRTVKATVICRTNKCQKQARFYNEHFGITKGHRLYSLCRHCFKSQAPSELYAATLDHRKNCDWPQCYKPSNDSHGDARLCRNHYNLVQSKKKKGIAVDIATSGKLLYQPKEKGGTTKTIIEIDGKNIKLPLHEVNFDCSTDSHLVTKEFHEIIKPTKIDPSIPVHELVHPDSKHRGYAIFARKDSKDKRLQKLYKIYAARRKKLGESLRKVPNKHWHTDDLAGGRYLPMGYGSFTTTHKGWPKPHSRFGKFQVPYIRNTIIDPDVQDCMRVSAAAMGAASGVIKHFFPAVHEKNMEMAENACDVTFPSAALQKKEAACDTYFYHNQAIQRCIGCGAPGALNEHEHNRIGLHVDKTDAPGIQLNQYWPMDGKDGCGGYVPNINLLLFAEKEGGTVFEVPSNEKDCVVLVGMNGKSQLHCGSGNDRGNCEVGAWSCRLIPYFRGPIIDFVNARKRAGNGPSAFIKLHGSKQDLAKVMMWKAYDATTKGAPAVEHT